MIGNQRSWWVDVSGGGVDHDGHCTAADADAPVDEQRQCVFDAALAVEQLSACEVAIEVSHGSGPFASWCGVAQSSWPVSDGLCVRFPGANALTTWTEPTKNRNDS
jgi:hypothetical protein